MARRDADARARDKGNDRSPLLDVLGLMFPVVSLAGALGLAVFILGRVDGRVSAAQAELASAHEDTSAQTAVAQPEQEVYTGVSDPWIEAGSFTVGSEELDNYISSYCDEHTPDGATAYEAAKETYEAIVGSTYLDRVDKPMGTDWVARSARDFFVSDDGMGGHQGDYYEFCATMALCFRYFGFGDAIAVPILGTFSSGEEYGSALVLVTSGDGASCVCDPVMGESGWMLSRSSYNILVDDIGQNLDAVQALGLRVVEKSQSEQSEDGSTQSSTQSTSSAGGSAYGTDGYDEYDEYGYDDENIW